MTAGALRSQPVTAIEERTRSSSAASDVESDLGFGSVVARESRRRLLNRDGSFNVRREGLSFWQSLSAYHYLLTISWPRFLGLVGAMYFIANALFASIYLLAGHGALTGTHGVTAAEHFADAFFFSVHTLATIGYGTLAPATLTANLIVTVEALVGMLGIALVAGMVFVRVARPIAQLLFSDKALIAPYRGGRAFMFRIVNQRSNQIVDLRARVMISRRKRSGGRSSDREFIPLTLERDRVAFFPLAWTIVHPIDENSPLQDWMEEDFAECDAEFLVLLNGFDDTFSQTVHARSSYKLDEIVWGARFTSMFNPTDDEGVISADIRRLHEYERVRL
jgi:inward rectifier potassium channel